MAKFAPVAPIQVLEGLYDKDPYLFGDYHLLLAHHTDEELPRFVRLFQRIQKDNIIRPTVIMDNSVVELGGFVDVGMMERVCGALATAAEDVTLIPVLPDVMGKGRETRLAVSVAYDEWSRRVAGNGFMAVVQGENFDDYSKSLDLFADYEQYPEITWLGIPRYLVKTVGSRLQATHDAVKYRGDHQSIHLLGYSDNMDDDIFSSLIEGVYGIDSAVPVRVDSYWHKDLEVPPRPADWFANAEFTDLMATNIELARFAHRGE